MVGSFIKTEESRFVQGWEQWDKSRNHLLDYPALSCHDVSSWTSTVVARECLLGPRRVQQKVVPVCQFYRRSVVNLPIGDVDIVYCFCFGNMSWLSVLCTATCTTASFVYGSRSPTYVLLLPNLFTACAWFNWFYLVIIAFPYKADLCKLKWVCAWSELAGARAEL